MLRLRVLVVRGAFRSAFCLVRRVDFGADFDIDDDDFSDPVLDLTKTSGDVCAWIVDASPSDFATFLLTATITKRSAHAYVYLDEVAMWGTIPFMFLHVTASR